MAMLDDAANGIGPPPRGGGPPTALSYGPAYAGHGRQVAYYASRLHRIRISGEQ